MRHNMRRFRREAADIRVLRPFPYFVLGFYLGRRRFLETFERHVRLVRRARWWTLGLGIGVQAVALVSVVLAPATAQSVLRAWLPALLEVGSAMLGFFYACVILLLIHQTDWRPRLVGLAAVGRLALSNYVLQTVVVTTLLYGYGAGLHGGLGLVAGLPVALLIFALQIMLSLWWIGRFRFGPLE